MSLLYNVYWSGSHFIFYNYHNFVVIVLYNYITIIMYNIINDDYHLIKHVFIVISSFVVLIECTLQRLVCDSSLVLYLLHVYTIYILAIVYNDLTRLCIKWLLFC